MRKSVRKPERNSLEKKTTTLGFVNFHDQIDRINRAGVQQFIARAYDTARIDADPDQILEDVTRELDFDLADYSQNERWIAESIEAKHRAYNEYQRELKKIALERESQKDLVHNSSEEKSSENVLKAARGTQGGGVQAPRAEGGES